MSALPVMSSDKFISLEMQGLRDVESALRALGQDRLIKNTNRRALRDAAMPAEATARRLAPGGPYSTGRMAAKIKVSSTLARRQRRGGKYRDDKNTAHVFIGAAPRGPAVLTEFGTGPRFTKSGKFTGAAPAQPFMRPAWEMHKHGILQSYSKNIWIQIEKSAKRLARRQAKLQASR